ncbi:MAG: hypothetical protein ACR2PT_03565 [Endozoicomonas sp.]
MIFSYWQKTGFPSQFSLVSILAFLILSSPLLIAQTIECSAFQVPEWREMCKSFDLYTAYIYVHDNIPEDGLNAEVDSWGRHYHQELHILPPKKYVLDKKIKLKSSMYILPNPTAPLPSGKTNRTIELSASDNFLIGSDHYFTLVELDHNVSVGGIEIQGEDISSRVAGYKLATENKYPRVLLYAPDSINVLVAGVVLTGAKGIDELVWNPFRDDYYLDSHGESDPPWETHSGLSFLRNNLSVNGSATGLLVTGGYHPPLVQNNSVLISSTHTNGAKTVGIRVEKGAATVKQNDIVFEDDDPAEKEERRGIEIDATEAVDIQSNAFYSCGKERDWDIGVWASASSKWMNLVNNSFSSLIRKWLFEGEDHKGAEVIANNNYLNFVDDDYWMRNASQPVDYFGNLGTFPVSPVYLAHGFKNTSLLAKPGENSMPQPVYDLISRSGYYTGCPYYVNPFEAIGFTVFFSIAIGSNIFCCGLGGWSCAARRCPWSAR